MIEVQFFYLTHYKAWSLDLLEMMVTEIDFANSCSCKYFLCYSCGIFKTTLETGFTKEVTLWQFCSDFLIISLLMLKLENRITSTSLIYS
jgi:hypothetical protein